MDAASEIHRLRAAGLSWRAVTNHLNTAGTPTPTGKGRWYPSTVIRHADTGSRDAWARYMRGYRRGVN